MTGPIDRRTLEHDIRSAINRHSAENGSDTPDFILAEYLIGCLRAFDRAVVAREKWYWRKAERVSLHPTPDASTTARIPAMCAHGRRAGNPCPHCLGISHP